jgi:MFS family permease
MTRLRIATNRTFQSMHVRNFRLYFFGQIVSASGSWMQSFAQLWLVLRLTHNGIALGITLALQFSPTLIGGAWGGLLADRADKRRLLMFTSTAATVLALILGAIVALDVVTLGMVYVLAFLLGCVTALDNPARRAFVVEMVGPENVANATSLSSAVFTAARIVGPAIAGLTIAGIGIAWCFFANAASFGAVILALVLMRRSELFAVAPTPRAKGQLRAGFRYVWDTPDLRIPLAMVAVIGTLSFNFQLVLSLITTRVFHQGSAQLGTMIAFMSVGSVLGALTAAHHARPTRRILVVSAFVFGALMTAAAFAPSMGTLTLLLIPTGFAGMGFLTMANSTLQLNAAPQMRGRVGALFAVAFLGSTPIGAPIVGWVAQQFGPRSGFVIGGVAALLTAAVVARTLPATSGARNNTETPVGEVVEVAA